MHKRYKNCPFCDRKGFSRIMRSKNLPENLTLNINSVAVFLADYFFLGYSILKALNTA
jgi:hypothetical protein